MSSWPVDLYVQRPSYQDIPEQEDTTWVILWFIQELDAK